jgi:alkylation response protein AidB-like acyl-CoA dehydrogenase
MGIVLDRPSVTAEERELRKELVGRAAKLVPLLAENAEQTESDRRVVEENIAALDEAGLLSIMRPKRFGGLETDFRTKLEVSRELARGCGSTSWVTSLMNVCSWFVGLYAEQAQIDVWGDVRSNRVAGVLAPTATATAIDGGWRVTGRWSWASGSAHAQWALVGVPVLDEHGAFADHGVVLIPMDEVTIEDTWFVAGMCGTASNTIVADDVFVPSHRYLSVVDAIQGRNQAPFANEALYQSAFIPVAALILAGPQLGLAQAALDLVVEKASKRAVSYTFYETQVASPSFQLAVAKAASLSDSAHLHAYRAAAEIDEAAHAGIYPDYDARAKARMDTGASVAFAREAIRILVSAHGASSFADSSPLQRIWRDSEVASRHAVVSPEISAEVYGKALLGVRGDVTALV